MRRDKFLLAGMLLFIALSWVWFVTDNSAALLPHGSVRIARTQDWSIARGQGRGGVADSYFWTTKYDLLHLDRSSHGETFVLRETLTPLDTLKTSAAPALKLPAQALVPRPTPDGSAWIYGLSNTEHHDIDTFVLDSQGVSTPLPDSFWGTNTVWTADGKGWLASRPDGLYLNSLNGMPGRKIDTMSISAWTPYVLGVNEQMRVIFTLGDDRFEPPAAFRRGLKTPFGNLTEFDLGAPTHNPKTWKVTMPPEALRGQLLLSPQADRILWIAEQQPAGLTLWMNRLRFGFTRAYEGDEEIYVSNLDGTGMKKIFSGPVERQRRGMNTFSVRPMTDIQWLPDGRKISFIYKDSLYIAPVD